MQPDKIKVLKLGQKEVLNIVDVLCDSFANYPVMRFVLGAEGIYEERLKTLINFFVMARIFRHEDMFGIYEGKNIKGVALTSVPGKRMEIAELNKLRDSVWSQIGSESKKRYQQFGDACAQFELDVPQIHLNMIGIMHNSQGRGFARQLMEQVNLLSLSDPDSTGISLTTEDPKKVTFYQHMGYNLLGEAKVSDQLMTWSFFKHK